jgi:hypothetical protein
MSLSQVEALVQTSLLIAPHGAGMVNALLLADHATVLEIFPYHVFMDTYQRMSTQTGLLYFPLFSNLPGSQLSWLHNPSQHESSESLRWVLIPHFVYFIVMCVHLLIEANTQLFFSIIKIDFTQVNFRVCFY